jgi:two-component system chemotaxis response regulator CheB
VPAISVLVVDDSVVVRRLLVGALAEDPGVEVVGVAANGQIAVGKVAQLKPDLITMDVEMPVMDGIETVRALRAAGHRMPIIMFSTLTDRGASATLDALSAGATDYVTKPSGAGSIAEALARVAKELLPRIHALVPRPSGGTVSADRSQGRPAAQPVAPRAPNIRLLPAPDPRPVRAVVVGSSTGGPEALSHFFRGLTTPLPVPMVVVQHMPPVFTRQLAARLDRLGPSSVIEVAGGEELAPGVVYIAPGDFHLELTRSGTSVRTRLSQSPPVNYCRPAVDVMVRSAVTAFGGDLLAVVLTGMGSDGRGGCEQVLAAGGRVIVQDEATSVVWGMPGAVATGPGAHAVLPLDDVADAVRRVVAGQGVGKVAARTGGAA